MYSLPLDWHGRQLKIAVLGAGGTGSAIVLNELIRLDTTLQALDSHSGLLVDVYDGSVVTQANITRQTFFATQVGLNKAEAVIWTARNLHGKPWKAMPHNVESFSNQLHHYDIIITAVDRPSVRYQISQQRWHKKILWLDMGNGHTDGQVILGELGKDKYLPTICDLYDFANYDDSDAERKSCSAEESIARQELGVNQFAARIGAQILWNLLRHGQIQSHGAYFDAKSLHVDPILIDEQIWAIYGYKPDTQPQEI